jgi:hypothetical protein
MDMTTLSDVRLAGTDGQTHRLGDLWEQRPIVLAFARHFG